MVRVHQGALYEVASRQGFVTFLLRLGNERQIRCCQFCYLCPFWGDGIEKERKARTGILSRTIRRDGVPSPITERNPCFPHPGMYSKLNPECMNYVLHQPRNDILPMRLRIFLLLGWCATPSIFSASALGVSYTFTNIAD